MNCQIKIAVTLLLVSIIACQVRSSATNSTVLNNNAKTRQALIVVDKTASIPEFIKSHSALIKIIKDLGYTEHIKGADDATLKLSKYGEHLYDAIILLCPGVTSLKGVTSKEIIDYVDSQGNVILGFNNNPGVLATQLASELGFRLKATTTSKEFSKTKLQPFSHIVGNLETYSSKIFSYSGIQFRMLKNELTTDILLNNAPVDDTRPESASQFLNNVLIGVMQARNNARVVVCGSTDFFKDSALNDSKFDNQHLIRNLVEWTFKEKSLLRCKNAQHKRLNVNPTPSTDISSVTNFEGYTINDDIEYSIDIEIYEKGKWSPYTGDDVQLEFVRIDPFIRQTMKHANGKYVARFKVPDVYGVYKFQVDYRKDGLTYLFSSTQVSIRPLRHNEYERFIYAAYPYYLSAFLMMIYLYIFSFIHLYQAKRNPKTSSKEDLKDKKDK